MIVYGMMSPLASDIDVALARMERKAGGVEGCAQECAPGGAAACADEGVGPAQTARDRGKGRPFDT